MCAQRLEHDKHITMHIVLRNSDGNAIELFLATCNRSKTKPKQCFIIQMVTMMVFYHTKLRCNIQLWLTKENTMQDNDREMERCTQLCKHRQHTVAYRQTVHLFI